MKLFCAKCAKELETVPSCAGDGNLDVVPCESCQEAERRAGYEMGYAEGLYTEPSD